MAKLTQEEIKALVDRAIEYRLAAYAPYSRFKVGAAVLGTDGKIYGGCNIENASFGLTNCAERTAIFKMVSEGCQTFRALAVVGGDDEPAEAGPCGACRQVMGEFCHDLKDTAVIMASSCGEYITESLLSVFPYSP